MCGITGAIWTDPQQAIESSLLDRMTDVLTHRGPDDRGTYLSPYQQRPPYQAQPGVALGHRRLSIIDVTGGKQPMPNEDETVWVVFNGEIYNYPQLRQRLEGAGHDLRTESDTEVIVHLYEDIGVECLQHLNGMFALAIWDAPRRRLVLARDRLGQKPLVYCLQPGRLLFASELKSLLQVPGVSRDLDLSAIDDYLTFQYVPHPKTIFSEIRKLPPAHYAVLEDGTFDIQSYWDPDFSRQVDLPIEEYIEQLQATIQSSVELRMRSDVPLGTFLSGGMDSSIVAACMKRAKNSSIQTFSVGFPVAQYDETSYARLVADHLKTDHREFKVVPDCVDIVSKLVWNFDEPFGDSSAIPTWYLSEWTRQHVTVALTGDGGDELFAGYDRYQAVRWGQRFDSLPYALRMLLANRLWQKIPASGRQKSASRMFQRFISALRLPPMRRYMEWIEIFHEAQRAELYTEDFLRQLPPSDPASFLSAAWRRAGNRDDVTRASLGDVTTYLPCDLLTKVDIASMAHGLECRQPLLDHRVVELAAQIPVQHKLGRRCGKRILWKAHQHMLPKDIGTRSKMGFGVPLGHWFRHELRDMLHDTLLGSPRRTDFILDGRAIAKLVQEHQDQVFDHGARLWALLVLELWMQEWA